MAGRPALRETPRISATLALLVTAALFGTAPRISPAAAQALQPGLAGKTVSIIVGSAPGGAFDAYARLLARHYPDHLPGAPSVVVRNMPGAASMIVAEHIFNVSPKDATEIGALFDTVPITQLLDPAAYPIRPEKFGWIGAINSATNVLVVWDAAGVKNIEAAKKTPVTVGSTTRLTQMDIYPRIANAVIGTKFNVVNGYEGMAAIDLAMQRGEIEGVGATYWASYLEQKSEWVKDGKVVPLFQVTFERDKHLPDTPTLMELAHTDEQRDLIKIITETAALGAPLVVSPGTPVELVGLLRRGFDETMKDPAFLTDAKEVRLDVAPTSGADLARMVDDMMASPPETVAKFKALVDSPAK